MVEFRRAMSKLMPSTVQNPTVNSLAELQPATLALMGTTDARNTWRDPIINILGTLGVSKDDIYNPVITNRSWMPEYDGPNELFQKQKSMHLLFYVGTNGEGSISSYSAFELADLAHQRPEGSMAVILDSNGLQTHSAKQIKAIKGDIYNLTPDMTVVESVGESIPWIAGKLGLQQALGMYATKELTQMVDNAHRQAMAPDALAQIEILGKKSVQKGAQPYIDQMIQAMMANPLEDVYIIPHMGIFAGRSRHDDNVSRFVGAHFTERGWIVVNNRDGDICIKKPK